MKDVSILIEAKKRYIEQLHQILTPRMYEGFESIYDNSLELLENEFEEKNQQTRSIAKVFQEALKEIPVWNQDIINHECHRITQVSNCDYLEDLIEAVFIAESKILTAVQSIKGKTKVHVPRESHFVHRCYISAAREIYKNPYVFNHSRDLTPQEKHNNMRHTLHLIQEGISNSIRELLPIRDILKKRFSKHELESDEESNDDSSVEMDYSDEDRKKRNRRRHHSSSSESESESESESDSESESEKEEEEHSETIEEETLDEEEEEGSIFNGIVNRISNVFNGKREDKQDIEVQESSPLEIPSHIPSHIVIEDESDIQEFTQYSEKEPIHLSFDEEEKEPIQMGSSQETESVIQAFIQEKLSEEENNQEEEVKQIVLDGSRIPKEYRLAPNPSPVKEEEEEEKPIIIKIKEPIIQEEEFSSSIPIEDDRISSISSGFVYKHPEPPKLIRRQDTYAQNRNEDMDRIRQEEYYTLDKLRRKERERHEREKDKMRQRLLKKQQLQMTHRNDLYEKNLAIYKQHHKSSESESMISGISSVASSHASRKERTKQVDSFLKEQQTVNIIPKEHFIPEGNKMLSQSERHESISYVQRPSMKIQPQVSISSIVRQQSRGEDSGDEYKSDGELRNA